MSGKRRQFLRDMLLAGSGVAIGRWQGLSPGLSDLMARIERRSNGAGATDEDFWRLIKQAFTVSPTLLNLNNGGVCPQPKVVQDAMDRYNRMSNETPTYYMWRILDRGREPIRQRLAQIAGCDAEEIAINRNATEALETAIFGLRLKEGDEVVLSKQDYPSMINAWKQREHRDGIVLKWVNFPCGTDDDGEIVTQYTDQFTEMTKVVHLTHMINWNGQILPVRAIADKAKERGIEVMVDSAHSFAHIPFRIDELNCDYLGVSLHKWLCAPFGTGFLYVRKDKIKRLYPLFASLDPEEEDIRKFEHLGTRSFPIEQAIGQAIEFHELIGGERKYERLYYLKEYWTRRVLEFPGVSICTPQAKGRSGALALLQIKDKQPYGIRSHLMSRHRIHTVSISNEGIEGVRITPNVYTLTSDLDRLVAAIEQYLEEEAEKKD